MASIETSKSVKSRLSLFSFALLLSILAHAQKYKVAITIDDLPCAYCRTTEEQQEVMEKLTWTLKEYNAPAIGFVNEGKLYDDKELISSRVEVLDDWLKAGFDLGNHTYSHISIDRAGVQEYESDLLKGEKITRPLMLENGKQLKYFRHTQLRTGPTTEYKEQLDAVLKKHEYKVAPVTFDNDEYIYGYCYHKARLAGDSASMRLIAYQYIDHMKQIFWHYKSLSKKMFDRNIAQVLLIHANELNADHLHHILDLLKADQYAFVDLDEALADDAYQLPEASSKRGLSWFLRWQLARGEEITEHPSASDKMQQYFDGSRSGVVASLQKLNGDDAEIAAILNSIQEFSRAYRTRAYDRMAKAYTKDGKMMPEGTGIVEGHDRIAKRWRIPEDRAVEEHIVTPAELTVIDDTAYDHGYYEGSTRMPDGSLVRWTGKYVIVWRKENGAWKMYLDIWNSI
jgi:ketosteroid isomerase-like protein/peptidoglycan/xylan/chitin deacetylase (PgdA/CDA1 family)